MYGSNDINLGGVFLGDSLGYTCGKVLGSNEGIKLGSSDGKVIGTVLRNVDGITIGINVGTYLGSLNGSLGGSNSGSLEVRSCFQSCGLSFHRYSHYPQGHRDSRHFCRSSSLDMVGSTRCGRGVDVRRYWVPYHK